MEDWTFAGGFGKIGLKAGTGWSFPTRVLYDNVVVTLLESDHSLNVPLFKQRDERWAQEEYDSAAQWSTQPTIGRWGCALTSLVMVMRHHGLTRLPDGQDLTPSSLNQWLTSQADGYLGNGVVNWLAATRLTRLISEQFQTTKLEYRRQAGNTLDTARTEIAAGRPVILEIDGHFLVADGVPHEGDDLLIKDPDYAYDHFSQHQTPLLSTRTFTPSQTDLSYLLLTHSPNLKVSTNSPAPQPWATYTESLKSDSDSNQEHSPALVLHEVAKPSAGTYTITISQDQLGSFTTQLYVYNQTGQPTPFKLAGIVGKQPLTWALEYDSRGHGQLFPKTSFADFRRHLALVKESKGFKLNSYFILMNQTTIQGEKAKKSAQKSYVKLLKSQLKAGSWFVSKTGYRYLDEQLRALEATL